MNNLMILMLAVFCILDILYIYLNGYTIKRMGFFIFGIMTMFLIYICMNNVYGFRNFFIGVFIFTLTIGVGIMTLCGLMSDV